MNFNRLCYSLMRKGVLFNAHSRVLACGIILIASIVCVAVDADAQVRVTAIWKDGQSLKKTEDVRCRHDNWVEEGIRVDMVLKPFDQLTSPSGLVYIELTAPKGSVFKGSDKLALMLLPTEKEDVVINVFSGNGEMQSAGGGVMTSGEVGLVVVKTEYSVRVRHTEAGPIREFLTFDGEVEISPPTLPRAARLKQTLTAGDKMVFEKNGVGTAKIGPEDLTKSAVVYARLDTAKAEYRKAIDREETYQTLLTRYVAVLAEPKKFENRFQLAVAQVNFEVNDAAVYQLKKAEQLTPADDIKTHARIALTKAIAFFQAGNPGAAQTEVQKARALMLQYSKTGTCV